MNSAQVSDSSFVGSTQKIFNSIGEPRLKDPSARIKAICQGLVHDISSLISIIRRLAPSIEWRLTTTVDGRTAQFYKYALLEYGKNNRAAL